VLQVDRALVVRQPVRLVNALHALGVQQVQRSAAVLLPGGQVAAERLVLLGEADQTVRDGGPRLEELLGARVGATGGGLADRPAGLVDLPDRPAILQRDQHRQVPHVVTGEVLEHGEVPFPI